MNVFIFNYRIEIPIFRSQRKSDYLQQVERLLTLPPIMLSLTACKVVNSAHYLICCVLPVHAYLSRVVVLRFPSFNNRHQGEFNASIIQAVRPVEKRFNPGIVCLIQPELVLPIEKYRFLHPPEHCVTQQIVYFTQLDSNPCFPEWDLN